MGFANKFCIFCQKILVDNDFEIVKDVIRETLVVLLPKVNFDSTNSVICDYCRKKALAAFEFKSTCLNTEEVISPYVVNSEGPRLDLKQIYMEVNKNEMKLETLDVDQKVCRLCMQLVTGQGMSLFDVEIEILKEFLPEMNFNISGDPVVCNGCYEFFNGHTEFLRCCLNVEIKVASLTVKESVASPDSFCMKPEDINMEIENEAFISIKNEEVELKVDNETVNDESDVSVHNFCMTTKDIKLEIENDPILPIEIEENCYKDELYDNSTFHEKEQENPSDTKWFHCDQCSFKTRIKINASRHQLVHKDSSEVQMHECKVCGFKTKYKGSLNYHETQHDPSKLHAYKCHLCSFATSHSKLLKNHQNRHWDVRIYECEECGFKAKTDSHLKKHHKREHADPSDVRMYKCNVCGFKTKHKFSLNSHLARHDPLKLGAYKCHQCSFATWSSSLLRNHQIRHFDVLLYVCDKCGYKAKTQYLFNAHNKRVHAYPSKRVHADLSKVQMYNCNECDYHSRFKTNFERHLIIHKNPEEVQWYECNKCNFKTKHKDSLRYHQCKRKSATNDLKIECDELEQVYKCDKCPYVAKSRGLLKKHMIRHSDVRLYQCDECDYKAKTQPRLRAHKLTHKDFSEVLIYNCNICGFQTKYRSSIWTHARAKHEKCDVTKLNGYKCDECPYATAFVDTLKKHQLKHSDLRIYECEQCGSKFKAESHLKTHLRRIHADPSEVQMYKCNECDYQSQFKQNVKRHLIVHKNPEEA